MDASKALAHEIKEAVLAELRPGPYAEWPRYAGGYGPRGAGWGYYSSAPYPTYQTIKESVKNEILAEIRGEQVDQMAQMYGIGELLSSQKIQEMVEDRYKTVDNLKADIKNKLVALQKMEAQQPQNPQAGQIAALLADKARQQGIPLEQVIRGLEQKSTSGGNLVEQLVNTLGSEQSRGFLCGMGSVIMCHLIWPFIKNNMQSVAARSVEEGMSMVERAKSMVCNQQPPSAGAVPPESPPDEGPPPG